MWWIEAIHEFGIVLNVTITMVLAAGICATVVFIVVRLSNWLYITIFLDNMVAPFFSYIERHLGGFLVYLIGEVLGVALFLGIAAAIQHFTGFSIKPVAVGMLIWVGAGGVVGWATASNALDREEEKKFGPVDTDPDAVILPLVFLVTLVIGLIIVVRVANLY